MINSPTRAESIQSKFVRSIPSGGILAFSSYPTGNITWKLTLHGCIACPLVFCLSLLTSYGIDRVIRNEGSVSFYASVLFPVHRIFPLT